MFMRVVTMLRSFTPKGHPTRQPLSEAFVATFVVPAVSLGYNPSVPQAALATRHSRCDLQLSTVIYTYLQFRLTYPRQVQICPDRSDSLRNSVRIGLDSSGCEPSNLAGPIGSYRELLGAFGTTNAFPSNRW